MITERAGDQILSIIHREDVESYLASLIFELKIISYDARYGKHKEVIRKFLSITENWLISYSQFGDLRALRKREIEEAQNYLSSIPHVYAKYDENSRLQKVAVLLRKLDYIRYRPLEREFNDSEFPAISLDRALERLVMSSDAYLYDYEKSEREADFRYIQEYAKHLVEANSRGKLLNEDKEKLTRFLNKLRMLGCECSIDLFLNCQKIIEDELL